MRTRIKVFLVLLVLLAAGLAALLLTGVLDLRPEAAPFVVSGPVRAVRLPMKGADGTSRTIRLAWKPFRPTRSLNRCMLSPESVFRVTPRLVAPPGSRGWST